MLFTGVFRGGVYRSLDNGKTWKNPSKEEFYNVISLAYNDSLLFASDFFGEGVFRSDNYGLNWEKVFEYSLVTCILAMDDTIFVTHDFGVEISTDYGETWQYANTGFNGFPQVEDIIYADGKYYAATDEGVYYAEDSLNWICINGNLPQGIHVHQVYASVQGILIFSYREGIFYSSDNGQYWELRPDYFYVSNFKETDTALFASSSKGLLYTKDMGLTWNSVAQNNSFTLNVSDVCFIDGEIIISSNKGVFRLDTINDKWVIHNTGIKNSNIYALHEKEDTLIAATDLGVLYSYNNGNDWHELYQELNYRKIEDIACYKNTVILLNRNNEFIYKSNNMDGPWENYSQGLNSHIWNVFTYDSVFLAITDSGFYKRGLNDTAWKPTGTGIPCNNFGTTTICGTIIYSSGNVEV